MRLRLDLQVQIAGRTLLSATLDSTAVSWRLSGPSGSGKSTLLRVLAGASVECTGRAELDGESWLGAGAKPAWQRRIGWAPQAAMLFPHLSVAQNLAFGHDASRPGPGVTEVADALRIAPLLARQPRHLSGGERQRVALGRALLASPRLLLLDEPFSALDRELRGHVVDVVREHCRRWQVPCLLVNHELRELEGFAEVELEVHEGALRLSRPSSSP